MEDEHTDSKIDGGASKDRGIPAGAGAKIAEGARKAISDAQGKLEGVATTGEHRLQEAVQKAGHSVKELTTRVVHGAQETAQKVIHRAKEVATAVEHRSEERDKKASNEREGQ